VRRALLSRMRMRFACKLDPPVALETAEQPRDDFAHRSELVGQRLVGYRKVRAAPQQGRRQPLIEPPEGDRVDQPGEIGHSVREHTHDETAERRRFEPPLEHRRGNQDESRRPGPRSRSQPLAGCGTGWPTRRDTARRAPRGRAPAGVPRASRGRPSPRPRAARESRRSARPR